MGRRRKIRLEFYVSEKELHMIQQKMVHTAVASGHGCGAQRPLCGLTATPI